MDVVIEILDKFGYPIAVTAAMFWYMVTEQRSLRGTIENNTAALTRLAAHMDRIEDVGDGDDGIQ